VVLGTVTLLVHLPFVAAVGYLGQELGWASPWKVAWTAGVVGVVEPLRIQPVGVAVSARVSDG